MTLNAKIGGFTDFLALSAWTSPYHSQGGATVLALVAWRSSGVWNSFGGMGHTARYHSVGGPHCF